MKKTVLQIIILTSLLLSCSTKKEETKADSAWRLEDWIPVVITNGDTLKWRNQDTDTIRATDIYRVKMYLPIRQFYKSGVNLLEGETKMQFAIGVDQPDNSLEYLTTKYFLVNQDTGTVEISMDTVITMTQSDSLFWTATVMKPDTAIGIKGHWIIKRK